MNRLGLLVSRSRVFALVLAAAAVLAVPLGAFASETYQGSGNMTGWVSYLQGFWPMPQYYLTPSPQMGIQASFNWAEPSFTIDDLLLTIALPDVVSKQSYTVGPGQVEDVTLTVLFNPVEVPCQNIGPVPLQLGQGGEYAVDESLWTGAYGILPDFLLTGTYTIDGPVSHVGDSFSIEMVSRPGRFLHLYAIQTSGYPDSLLLLGIDKSYEPHWYPKDAAPGERLWQSVLFVDSEVDGYLVQAGMDYVNVDTKGVNQIAMSLVPEPATLALLAVGSLVQLRRRRAKR